MVLLACSHLGRDRHGSLELAGDAAVDRDSVARGNSGAALTARSRPRRRSADLRAIAQAAEADRSNRK